jgi:hypothetical protein
MASKTDFRFPVGLRSQPDVRLLFMLYPLKPKGKL